MKEKFLVGCQKRPSDDGETLPLLLPNSLIEKLDEAALATNLGMDEVICLALEFAVAHLEKWAE